jgi:hypothetical protein
MAAGREVRRTALANVHLPSRTAATADPGRGTLLALLGRVRDVDAGVRRALFKRLGEADVGFEYIPCEWRERLLLDGLRDRCEGRPRVGTEPTQADACLLYR